MKKQLLLGTLCLLFAAFSVGNLFGYDTTKKDFLDKNVSISFQNTEIQDALAKIEKIAEIRFIYSPKAIHAERKVSFEAQNQKLSEVLTQFLTPLGVGYKLQGNQIILSNQTKITAIESAELLFAPIKGKITSATGEALPGVTIAIKGTSKGTTSDSEGNFSIDAEKGQVLVLSFIGYKSKEITVGDETSLTISLDDATTQLNEFVVVGSRTTKPRTDVERPAPVDVLTSKELQNTGQVDLGQMLQFTSPSFNSSKNGINGVANYADPATLRGMSPDQVLVLIDGKRRHQFSALNLNITIGKGTVVTDMNSIPSLATDRLEILRDGAAAQYDSDAIAGIINVGLNKSVGKGTFKTQYGVTSKGDGASYLAAANYGIKLGKEKSYLNMTLHYQYADGTDRSDPFNGNIYSANAAAEATARTTRGVYPTTGEFRVSQYGSNQTEAYQTFVNVGYPINDKWSLYGFGGFSQKNIKAFGFFRNAIPTNANSNVDIFPDGYSPILPGKTIDYSGVVGIKRQIANEWNIDFSTGYGYNSLDLNANNTSNPSMGASSPKDFYVGKSAFGQSTTELNLSKNFDGFLNTKTFNFAVGSQFRIDQFILGQGDRNSWFVGDLARTRGKAPGSSGRPGIAPDDETNVTRTNIGVYVDVESDITNKLLVAAALRYENYSDFGGNLSGKLATRLKLTESFSIRGSINRGFRAPSLQQIYNSVTTSAVQAGEIRQTKQLRSDEPRLSQIGIGSPKAETSWNYNVGITANVSEKLLVTLDAYQIDIADRIIVSEPLIVNNIAALRPLFPGIQEISFFTNQISTRTQGIDLVTTYKHEFNQNNGFTASLALTLNKTEINKIDPTPTQLQEGTARAIALIDTISISLIETSQPRNKVLLSLGYQWKKLNITVRTTYFGEVTAWEKPANLPHRKQAFAGKTLTDIVLNYNIGKKFMLTLGANNVFDVYPDKVFTTYASYFNGQTPYTRNANQFGFNGAFYYANLTFNF